MSCAQRALRSGDVGAAAESGVWAEAEFIMPAVKATAITMVERRRAERISVLTTKHDLKTPDHGRLPATASTPADKWVRDGALLPVSLKIHTVECVGRSVAP